MLSRTPKYNDWVSELIKHDKAIVWKQFNLVYLVNQDFNKNQCFIIQQLTLISLSQLFKQFPFEDRQ